MLLFYQLVSTAHYKNAFTIETQFLLLPMRSTGPVPRFSPLIVTFVHGIPSFGEMPVTRGGCRDRDIVFC